MLNTVKSPDPVMRSLLGSMAVLRFGITTVVPPARRLISDVRSTCAPCWYTTTWSIFESNFFSDGSTSATEGRRKKGRRRVSMGGVEVGVEVEVEVEDEVEVEVGG
jgi:hypothetical protein